MFISSEKDEVSLPLESGKGSSRSPPAGSSPGALDGSLPVPEFQDSPPIATIVTDVGVVPEHEKHELELSILNLEGEIAQLREEERQLVKKRREALNKIIDLKGSIRVFCRVRPFLLTEKRKFQEPISTESEKVVVRSIASRKEFRFDKVFPHAAAQDDIFKEVEPILRSALDGHNVTIMAYGQTGTGKTFTMDGSNNQPGIIPRALEVLFHQTSLESSSSINLTMSMLEVYMGSLRDLLAPKAVSRMHDIVARCNLNIQTDPKGLVEIEGLTEVQIPYLAKAKWWYAKGRRARSTSWTNVNETSSRSHCLTRITISRYGDDLKAKPEVSKLWLVDLGGSERLLKTGATGLILDEGRAINLSLSSLGDVIAALRRKRGHVPYRNSKLTQILKDSLGHCSKVLMLVHISPCEDDIGETICSLNFANRARAIEINGEASEDVSKQRQKRMLELGEDMREAEEELQKVWNQLKKAEFLLSENRKLFSSFCQLPEDKSMTTIGPQADNNDANKTPPVIDRTILRSKAGSLPRFMTSTVASRQRQNATERDIVGRTKSLRLVARNSVQFSASQSLSYTDIRLKGILRESNRGQPCGETKALLTDSPKCNGLDPKATSLSRTQLVSSSDPSLKATLGRHRRRMSNLI